MRQQQNGREKTANGDSAIVDVVERGEEKKFAL